MVKFYKVDFDNKLSEMGVTYALDLFVKSDEDNDGRSFGYVLDKNGYLAIDTYSENMHQMVCEFLRQAGAIVKELRVVEEHS